MNKQRREFLIEKGKESPIWLLEMRIGRQNRLLIELKSQGVTYKDRKWKTTVQKRNIYRKILIEKLKEWNEGKISESNPNYSDYVSYEKDKQNNEFEISQRGKT